MTPPTFKEMNDLFKRLDVSSEHLNHQVENQTPPQLGASGEQTAADIMPIKQGYLSSEKLDDRV